MWLKRTYDQSKLKRDPDTGAVTEVLSGAVTGVKVQRAGKVQNFSQGFLDGGVKEGWLTLAGGRITVHNDSGKDVVYRILRTPGYYCCHCDAELPDAGRVLKPGFTDGMRHVAESHGSSESPDPGSPNGYRRDNFYACILETEEVNTMSDEEALEMERGIRETLHSKIKEKVLNATARARAKTGGE